MYEQGKLKEIANDVHEYLNIRYELIVLKASDKISTIVSETISGFLILFMLLLVIVFLSFAGAYYASTVYGNSYSGFFIVGGVYFVLGLFILIFRKRLFTKPLRNKIIREFFNESSN